MNDASRFLSLSETDLKAERIRLYRLLRRGNEGVSCGSIYHVDSALVVATLNEIGLELGSRGL
jgi:hypothetical protein